MGLLSTIKGWLNIGGVKLLLWKYTEPLSRANPVITGAVLIKTKSDKTVTSLEVKVVEEVTEEEEGDDGEKKKVTTTNVLGSAKFPDHEAGLGYPLDLKAGADQEQTFTIHVAIEERLQDRKGVLGGIGKLAAFGSGEKTAYFIVAEAAVKGAAFKTTAKEKLKVGP
jgi:hypothetical protein